MNVEGIFALGFFALLFACSRTATAISSSEHEKWYLPVLLAVLVVLCFFRYLAFPLVADDYAHVLHGAQANWDAIWTHFALPEEDRFFRPLGYVSYALDARWAGFHPAAWRAGNLLFHVANTVLLYFLCRRLRLGTTASFFGALLFGVHASNPEVVTWVAARFDLLAVLFGLLCLLCVLGNAIPAASVALVLAILSKESAYILPLLACLLLWCEQRSWREIGKRTASLFALSALLFFYRWHLLGGIGGYHDATDGTPTVFHFRFASTVKALLPRFWAAMLFPLNWTGELSFWVAFFLAIGVIALLVLVWRSSAARRPLLFGFLFASLCSLPVHQFLSIGPDLEKSRVLYFASIGFAMMVAATASNYWAKLGIVSFLLFQTVALQHNLEIWKQVGYLAARTCEAGSTIMERNHRPLLVLDLPNVVDGVYFLHTGYPECVQMKSGLRPLSSLSSKNPSFAVDWNVWQWQEASRQLVRIQ